MIVQTLGLDGDSVEFDLYDNSEEEFIQVIEVIELG
jgi:hypothetical protein